MQRILVRLPWIVAHPMPWIQFCINCVVGPLLVFGLKVPSQFGTYFLVPSLLLISIHWVWGSFLFKKFNLYVWIHILHNLNPSYEVFKLTMKLFTKIYSLCQCEVINPRVMIIWCFFAFVFGLVLSTDLYKQPNYHWLRAF